MIDIKIGNSFELIKTLENKSIDCVFTSPPYWGLRDYKTPPIIFDEISNCEHEWGENIIKKQSGGTEKATVGNQIDTRTHYVSETNFCTKCGAWKGQLGLEPTPELFIKHLLDFFDDVKLKLKDEGNCFVNLGDTYSTHGSGSKNSTHNFYNVDIAFKNGIGTLNKRVKSLPEKCLCMIPQRFAWGMIEHGWILRNENIWYKRNHMPESVVDRWTKSTEKVYFFTKQQKNYFDLDAIRKPLSTSSIARISQKNVMNQNGGEKQDELRGNPENENASRCNKMVQAIAKKYNGKFNNNDNPELFGSPRARTQRQPAEYEGKWKENQEYLNHFQQRMNEDSANGVLHDETLCNPLGKNPGDVIQIDEELTIEDIINTWKEMHPEDWNMPEDFWDITTKPFKGAHFATFPMNLVKDPILAGCPENGIVLDPFGGSGTVGEFCKNNKRNTILFELNPEYKDLIAVRTYIKPKPKGLFDF